MRQCSICGKGSTIVGKRRLLRGHYNPVARSRKYPNLQWAKVSTKGGSASAGKGVRKLICTSCFKSLHRKTQ